MTAKCKSFLWEEVELFTYFVFTSVDPDLITEEFEIGNVDICNLNALYENLEVDGQVKRRKAD